MSENEELKHVDSKEEKRMEASEMGIEDVEASERPRGHIFTSKELDWVDGNAHGVLGRMASFLANWGVESRGMIDSFLL